MAIKFGVGGHTSWFVKKLAVKSLNTGATTIKSQRRQLMMK